MVRRRKKLIENYVYIEILQGLETIHPSINCVQLAKILNKKQSVLWRQFKILVKYGYVNKVNGNQKNEKLFSLTKKGYSFLDDVRILEYHKEIIKGHKQSIEKFKNKWVD